MCTHLFHPSNVLFVRLDFPFFTFLRLCRKWKINQTKMLGYRRRRRTHFTFHCVFKVKLILLCRCCKAQAFILHSICHVFYCFFFSFRFSKPHEIHLPYSHWNGIFMPFPFLRVEFLCLWTTSQFHLKRK